MNENESMSALAEKYGLKDGKKHDFYNSHGKWCVTKKGATKIEKAEGITWKVTDTDITPVAIAYRGTFECEGRLTPELKGVVVNEIGSCRFNSGTKTYYRMTDANGKEQVTEPLVKNPEITHTPEMAWKRLFVRGILALVAAGTGIYGADEFSNDWHRNGNNNGNGNGYNQQGGNQNNGYGGQQGGQQNNHQQAQPQPAPKNADGTTDWRNDPRIRNSSQADGWFEEAWKIPGEWNITMAKFCDLTHEPRSKWEGLLFNHAGSFQGRSGWWIPTNKYKSFNDAVFAVDTYQAGRKSKAGWALKVMHDVQDLLGVLENTGMVLLQVPDTFGVVKEYKMLKHGYDESGFPPGAAPDNVPKPENESQAAPEFPSASDFGGGAMANDDVPF